ncbi:hypothetical protein MGYG_07244 [Nannizzia gypsea CBS 118893]|uniref:Uncharacterized protein n=1 Tax=Arthroderma gypseum (strain ATCC MYA-4604 / CBS 118893) TaxID=535722 RepID=E4V2H2_ARTGP|nr:hypothetical protein MGYG_07244 [Nannizzia gypsea CBS 118893]EFR04237.1 hypothetical protein MGYG_07244 [Nannizzia gypsea CBS 118893]
MTLDNGVRVQRKGVYMLLRKTTTTAASIDTPYHWGVLIATSEKTGAFFHQKRNRDKWTLALEIENISTSLNLLCALKIGAVEDCSSSWMSAIEACMRQTEVRGYLTFRTWALAAAFELADGGFIGMLPSWDEIAKVDAEAKVLAGDACSDGNVKVGTSVAARLDN